MGRFPLDPFHFWTLHGCFLCANLVTTHQLSTVYMRHFLMLWQVVVEDWITGVVGFVQQFIVGCKECCSPLNFLLLSPCHYFSGCSITHPASHILNLLFACFLSSFFSLWNMKQSDRISFLFLCQIVPCFSVLPIMCALNKNNVNIN